MIIFILGLIIGILIGVVVIVAGLNDFLEREGYVITDGHLYRKIDKLQ